MCVDKHAGQARDGFSDQGPGQPVKACGSGSGAFDPSYEVDKLPAELVADATGVYGVLPLPGTQFAPPKWPVDWTNPEQVAAARTVRLDYHQGLADEKTWVAEQMASGAAVEDVARELVDIRNAARMSKYAPEKLPVLFERNLAQYGNKMGPDYDSLLAKYGSAEDVIKAGTRSNPAMDMLTGIATLKGS